MRRIAGAVALSVLSVSASVQASEYKTPEKDWMLLVTPFVWGASLKGDVKLAGIKSHVDMPFSKIAGHVDSVFMGNVEFRWKKLGLMLDGFSVDTSQSEQLLGNKTKVSITQRGLLAGAYYRVWEQPLGGLNHFGEPRTLTLDPMVGVRWTRLKAGMDVPAFGVNVKKSVRWSDPMVGLRVSADMDERWQLMTQLSVGGFDGSHRRTLDAQAYVGYRTYWFDQPTIIRAGYRILSQRFETDDFTGNKFRYDLDQKGPAIGVTVRF